MAFPQGFTLNSVLRQKAIFKIKPLEQKPLGNGPGQNKEHSVLRISKGPLTV